LKIKPKLITYHSSFITTLDGMAEWLPDLWNPEPECRGFVQQHDVNLPAGLKISHPPRRAFATTHERTKNSRLTI